MPEIIDTTVSTTPPPAAPPAPPAAAGPSAEDLAARQAEIDALKAENTSLRHSSEFWAQRAQATPPAPAAAAAPPEPEPEDNTDLLDLLTTGGPKAFDRYMKSKGYVTRTEAEEMASAIANSKASQLTTESQLLSKYPDLANKQSEFFRATASHYGELVKEGVPEQLAMKIAAERAELDGFKSGKVKTPAQRTTDQAAEAERKRQARISAQAGDRGNRPAADAEPEDDDTTLTEAQKAICRGMDISEEAYIARLKKGTALGGLPRGRN
jgi:hypothetical protein